MKKRYKRPLTPAELAAMPDEDIDYSDIPETTAEFWASAERVEPGDWNLVTIRVTKEVLDHFQRDGVEGSTSRMSRVLSDYVKTRIKRQKDL